MSLIPKLPKEIANTKIEMSDSEKEEFTNMLKTGLVGAMESINETIKKDSFTLKELIGGALKSAKNSLEQAQALNEHSEQQKQIDK